MENLMLVNDFQIEEYNIKTDVLVLFTRDDDRIIFSAFKGEDNPIRLNPPNESIPVPLNVNDLMHYIRMFTEWWNKHPNPQ